MKSNKIIETHWPLEGLDALEYFQSKGRYLRKGLKDPIIEYPNINSDNIMILKSSIGKSKKFNSTKLILKFRSDEQKQNKFS